MSKLSYQRYGEALFSLAQDEKKVKAYLEALKGVQKDFEKTPELQPFLSSYAIEQPKLYQIIDEAYGDSACRSLASFLKVLVKDHVIGHFDEVVASYRKLANESLGIEEGIVYSTHLLSEKEMAEVSKSLEQALGKGVSLENHLDPALLGGIKVAIAGKVYDGSLENKVENLKSTLLKSQGGIQ